MLDFDKFTNYSQEILSSASNLMASHKNSQMEPEHVMLAMIKDNGIIKDYLTELRLLNQTFINKIVSRVENFPKISGAINPHGLYLSNDTRRILELAIEESEKLKDDFVGIESILLAMTKLDNSNIKTALQDMNINSMVGQLQTAQFKVIWKSQQTSNKLKECSKLQLLLTMKTVEQFLVTLLQLLQLGEQQFLLKTTQ